MHLEKYIDVTQGVELVSEFFFNPSSLAKWDKSVKEVVLTPTNPSPTGIGATFDTIAPGGLRMSYRVIELDYGKQVKIALLDSNMFKEATWQFTFKPLTQGTRITCSVNFKTKLQYFFLVPVLYIYRGAILTDLGFLKDAINKHEEEQPMNIPL